MMNYIEFKLRDMKRLLFEFKGVMIYHDYMENLINEGKI